ncbi:RtcB family protein, partial [candidate division NPL-UPA2 bacterium]|nr:RtcB family protein [candidate division NPL-UPA2 bacterium]
MSKQWSGPLERIDDYRWRIPKSFQEGMRVPGLIYADEKLFQHIKGEQSLQQVANVAHLPGIVNYSLAMPDIHWGYGFCIGGVAATDIKEGVISPGGIGYDINCLCGKSLILHSLGYHVKMEDFRDNWPEQEIGCLDFRGEVNSRTKIVRFLKWRPKNKVYKVTTKTGRSIIATEEHPFYTKDGMRSLKNLREGEDVAVYPFEGVPYEEPSDKVVLAEEDVKEFLLSAAKDSRGQGREQILLHLRKRNLIPLRYDSPQLPYLAKIMGYAFGDATIHFVGQRGKGITWFYGKEENLEEIRQDIAKIGYNPSRIYSRKREHKITTAYSGYQFINTETSFKVCSSSFAALLVALGTPLGNKTEQEYGIPAWLLRAPRWQKRLFLAAFFGAEMSSPQILTGHKYNFYSPAISMNKKEKYLESGRAFLEEIGRMLREFNVPVKKISSRLEKVNDKEGFSCRLRLFLSNRPQDMINLYSKIGFEYNRERRFLANVAVHY